MNRIATWISTTEGTWTVALAVGLILGGNLAALAQSGSKGKDEMESSAAAPPLQAELDARRAAFTARAPQETQDAYDQGVEDVKNGGVMESALTVGDTAPDFTLPNALGNDTTLSTLLQDGPVVLTWYRGGWCPYCNIALQHMQRSTGDFAEHNATVVAISPETPDNSLSTAEKNELAFEVLSDVNLTVSKAYGVVYTLPEVVQEQFAGRLDLAAYNGTDSNELPLAATYVIGQDGTIAWAFVDEDYRVRAEPSDILAALEAL